MNILATSATYSVIIYFILVSFNKPAKQSIPHVQDGRIPFQICIVHIDTMYH